MAGLIGDNPILLDNASGTEKSFSRLKGDTTQSTYIDTDDSGIGTPVYMTFKQQVSKDKNGIDVQRTLVQLTKAAKTSTGLKIVGGINFTIFLPQDSALSTTDMKNLAGHLTDLISDGGFSGSGFAGVTNLDKLLLGILP